jgi:RNA polymerase sigma-70 factor (ECF subfamily)
MSRTPPLGGSAVEDFYEGAYVRLVSVVAVAAGNRGDAEEVVQEAFIRLLRRWSQVSRYDDPEAWVRKVAFRLLSNRRRKAGNGVRAVLRYGTPHDVDGPTGDRLDVADALLSLPLAQRQVLVLHHLVGLDVADVATELGVPVGTVKSRLSRGRSALAPLLAEESTHA